MKPHNPPRAAVYARVSTADQADTGTSLDAQGARCRRQAEADSCVVVAELADGGQSGKDMDRTGWRQVMMLAETGQLDRIYVVKPDRFARSLRHHLETRQQLDDLGVELVLLEGHVDRSTPIGDYTDKQLALVAELERNLIRQRMTEGQAARAAEDKWVGGPPPYGYRLQPAEDGKGTVLAVDPVEGRVIRRVYRMLAEERLSTGQVARVLNANGVATRRGSRWGHRAVRALLSPKRLATYSGRHQWGDWSIACPALLSFVQVETLTAVREGTATPRPVQRHHYLLVGRINSPHGAIMYGQPTHNDVPFYRCPDRTRQRRPADVEQCSCVGILTTELDDLVWEAVTGRLSDPGLLSQLVAEHESATKTLAHGEPARLADVNNELQELYRKKARLLDLLTDSDNPDPGERKALDDVQRQIDGLEGSKAGLQAKRVSSLVTEAAVTGRLDELTQIAQQGIASLVTSQDRQKVLAMMDAHVQVDRWAICPTCDGNGLVPVRTAEDIRRRVRIPGRTADVCPTCHRTRHVAYVTLTGVIPVLLFDAIQGRQLLELPARPDAPTVPFVVTTEVA